MATNCTLRAYASHNRQHGDSRTSEVSAVVSLADVVVNTTPTSTGGWNTATVTADLQRTIFLSAAAAASAGIPPGWYERDGLASFRKML